MLHLQQDSLSYRILSTQIHIHLLSFQGYLCSRFGRYAIFLSGLSSVSSADHPPFLCLSKNSLQTDEIYFSLHAQNIFPTSVSRLNIRIDFSRCGGDDIGRYKGDDVHCLRRTALIGRWNIFPNGYGEISEC